MSEPDNEVLVAPHEGVGADLNLNLSASTIPDEEYRASGSQTLLAGSRSRYRSGSQSSSSRPNSPSVSGSQTLSGSGSQPLHSSRPNSPSGSGSQPSSKSGSQHLYSSRINSPSGSQNLYRSGSQQSVFRNSPTPNSSTPKGTSSQSRLSHLFSSNSQRNASSPKTPMSESRPARRRLHDPRKAPFDFSDGESDFAEDDPSRTETHTEVVSTPRGVTKFYRHRHKMIEIKPLSEEQVKSDSRYHLRTMFKLTVSNDDGVSKHYQCLLCLPKFKLIWTSKTTYQHLEKHVVAVHPAELKRYRELMANKSGYK